MQTTQIARYTYHMFSSREEDAVVIFLYDDEQDVVGEVFFVADEDPLPAAAEAGGRVALYFHRSQLPAVVDMLRNEGPIHLRWAGPHDTCVSTEYESIGEGEGAVARRRRRPP